MVSHWSLSDNKSPQVSMTLFSILVGLNRTVVFMVSTRPLYQSFNDSVQRAPITMGITVTFIFHSFSVLQQGPGTYLFFPFFQFYSVVSRDGKVRCSAGFLFLLFLLTVTMSNRLAEIR